jgi:hypothetical protein
MSPEIDSAGMQAATSEEHETKRTALTIGAVIRTIQGWCVFVVSSSCEKKQFCTRTSSE